MLQYYVRNKFGEAWRLIVALSILFYFGNVSAQCPTLSAVVSTSMCVGQSSGGIDLTVTGGTAPFIYSWSNGATTQDISNEVDGTYTCTVTSGNSCVTTITETILSNQILTLEDIITNPSCFGFNNGAINIVPGNGTQPYTYHWSNGTTTEDLSSITAGSYSVVVIDDNGCSISDAYTLTQPTLLTVTETHTNVLCFGQFNGTITTNVTGGTLPYNFLWNNNNNNQNLINLDAGNYNLTGISNADITRKTITGTAADKIYDRLTTASITLVGVETIDTSNVTVTGNFNTKDVSVNPKSVTGTISGSMSTNYTLGSVSSAMVNAKRLTGITINKQYNGSRSATVLLNGVIEGDSVQVSANFSDKNAGDAKTVTGSIYGTDVNNYYIDSSSISVGNIEQKQVAVVLANKTYDGSTTASGTVQDLEVISGVTDNVLFNGYYISRDASDNVGGTGTLSGTDAYNYNISSIVHGRIYQKSLTGTTRNKVYDGLNTATVDLSGVITIDSVVDNVNAVCTFASVRVGNNIVVAGSLSGTAANNYLLSSVSTANITPLTITATTSNKTYDGNNSCLLYTSPSPRDES
jgi:hypothetical protein